MSQMGAKEMFIPGVADFAGICANSLYLYVSKVIHKLKLLWKSVRKVQRLLQLLLFSLALDHA